MGDWTGTLISSLNAGAKLRGVDADMLRDIADAQTSAWTDWVPTLTNLTQGNGTVTAQYRRAGKTGDLRFIFTFGSSGSAVGTNPQFSLPFTLDSAISASGLFLVGQATLVDAGTARRLGVVQADTSTTLSFAQVNATPAIASITATSPWTWAVGDLLMCNLVGLELA